MTVGAAPGRLLACSEIFSIPGRWALSASSSALRERIASRSPMRLSCAAPIEGRLPTATTHRDRQPLADRSKAEARPEVIRGSYRSTGLSDSLKSVTRAVTTRHDQLPLGLARDDPNGSTPLCGHSPSTPAQRPRPTDSSPAVGPRRWTRPSLMHGWGAVQRSQLAERGSYEACRKIADPAARSLQEDRQSAEKSARSAVQDAPGPASTDLASPA